MPGTEAGGRDTGLFVVTSELRVAPEGAAELTGAFRDRLRLVDGWSGFRDLEVWQDRRDESRFVMTSWWESREAFAEYMRSDDHRRSHDRVPGGVARPSAVSVSRFDVVAR